MTIIDADIVPVSPTVIIDDKKASLAGMDMSESFFDYDLLLGDVGSNNSNNTSGSDKDTDSLLGSLFQDDNEEVSDNNSSNSLSPPNQMNQLKRPKIMQWGPQNGQEISTIVSIVFEHNEETGPMKIVFGSMTVETAQQQHSIINNSNSNSVWITLAASVPSFADTRSPSNEVQISVCLFDSRDPDLALDTWDIGKFTYCSSTEDTDNSKHRKRALSCETIELAQKKTTFAADKHHGEEENNDINYQLLKLLAPYDPLIHMNTTEQLASPHTSGSSWTESTNNSRNNNPIYNSSSNSIMLQHGMVNSRPVSNQMMYNMNSQQHYMSAKQHMYRNYIEMQQQQRQQQQQQQQHPQQNFIMQQQQQQHHLMSQAMNSYMNNPIHNHNNASKFYPKFNNNNDMLYNLSEQQQRQNFERVKQLQQQQYSIVDVPRRASAPASSYSITNSNSCALNKAHLKLNGDLMDMAVNWNISEWQSGRRLVQFWRHTKTDADGNLSSVECGFDPMDQQVYHQQRMRDNVAAVAAAAAAAVAVSNSPSVTATLTGATSSNNTNIRPSPIVISCIYWRERNDYFITSVDCIYLLESLIGIQFTVEEKNRIRRNLEGFRPLTVSKCKSECADFFKLVMSFPHPKPRNIEKDVKVFSWKTLPHALRKIIRKYTPSYTTTTPLEPIH